MVQVFSPACGGEIERGQLDLPKAEDLREMADP
jgi:hypothetical protein